MHGAPGESPARQREKPTDPAPRLQSLRTTTATASSPTPTPAPPQACPIAVASVTSSFLSCWMVSDDNSPNTLCARDYLSRPHLNPSHEPCPLLKLAPLHLPLFLVSTPAIACRNFPSVSTPPPSLLLGFGGARQRFRQCAPIHSSRFHSFPVVRWSTSPADDLQRHHLPPLPVVLHGRPSRRSFCLPQNSEKLNDKLLYSRDRIRVIFTSNHQSEASEETKER
jgi:hypothetical protein